MVYLQDMRELPQVVFQVNLKKELQNFNKAVHYVYNSHILHLVLKTVRQHLYSAHILSIVKHQQIKVELKDQRFFPLSLISRKRNKTAREIFSLILETK